jgi:hypothetical protein
MTHPFLEHSTVVYIYTELLRDCEPHLILYILHLQSPVPLLLVMSLDFTLS